VPGHDRDLVEAPESIGGMPFVLIDTAGLRESGDEVEAIGVTRAESSIEAADLILCSVRPDSCPDARVQLLIASKSDLRRGR
jgi:tRNA modification GTPase